VPDGRRALTGEDLASLGAGSSPANGRARVRFRGIAGDEPVLRIRGTRGSFRRPAPRERLFGGGGRTGPRRIDRRKLTYETWRVLAIFTPLWRWQVLPA
jgi:hypothetical protein